MAEAHMWTSLATGLRRQGWWLPRTPPHLLSGYNEPLQHSPAARAGRAGAGVAGPCPRNPSPRSIQRQPRSRGDHQCPRGVVQQHQHQRFAGRAGCRRGLVVWLPNHSARRHPGLARGRCGIRVLDDLARVHMCPPGVAVGSPTAPGANRILSDVSTPADVHDSPLPPFSPQRMAHRLCL